jgi:putative endonuclease
MANGRRGTLYAGVTSDLRKRVGEHREKVRKGFTARYGVDILVWFERYDMMDRAIAREEEIKDWKRARKIEAIENFNPEWKDLYEGLW